MDFDKAEEYALESTLREIEVDFSPQVHKTYKDINDACWRAFEDGKITKQELRLSRFEMFLKVVDRTDVKPSFFQDHYLGHLSESDFMVPGSKDLLTSLHPHASLVVVTNGLKEVQRPRLKKAGLTEFFDAIVVSDEIGVGKPHKGFFDVTFEQIDHPDHEQVLMIGDNLNSDIKGGQNYGLKSCWFNKHHKSNTTEIVPDFEARNMDELNGIVF